MSDSTWTPPAAWAAPAWSVALAPSSPLPREVIFFGSEKDSRREFHEEKDRRIDAGNPDGKWVVLVTPDGVDLMFCACQVIGVRAAREAS